MSVKFAPCRDSNDLFWTTCDWTVNCTIPLRETRSTRAPTVHLEVKATCGFESRRDDHKMRTKICVCYGPKPAKTQIEQTINRKTVYKLITH